MPVRAEAIDASGATWSAKAVGLAMVTQPLTKPYTWPLASVYWKRWPSPVAGGMIEPAATPTAGAGDTCALTEGSLAPQNPTAARVVSSTVGASGVAGDVT